MINTILEARLQEAIRVHGKVRPIHKQRLADERLNAAAKPEPMTLMRKREKLIDTLYPKPKPMHTLGVIDKAARAAADWDLNDPFTYGRTALHVKQGYCDPAQVVKEAEERTIARKAARRREAEKEKTLGTKL